MNPLRDFKSEIKLFLIVACVAAFLAVGGILLLKATQPAPVVQTPPLPAPSSQPQAIDNQQSTPRQDLGQAIDTSSWQTYRNDEFGFEVRYPNSWVVKSYPEYVLYLEEGEAKVMNIGVYSINREVIGISYCEDNYQDIPRCERFKSGDISGTIDWDFIIPDDSVERPVEPAARSASALVDIGNNVSLSVQLNDLSMEMSSQTKAFFRTFLATFRFVETPELKELLDSNKEFNELFQTVVTANAGFSSEDFTPGSSKPISTGYAYVSNPEDQTYPTWTVSPDGLRAVSAYTSFGEPDSSLSIYNRNNQGKVERLKFCGTPCYYWGTLWLNNEQFIFMQSHEYHPPDEVRCTIDTKCTYIISFSLFDLKENIEIIYKSPEIKQPGRPKKDWADWEERIRKIR